MTNLTIEDLRVIRIALSSRIDHLRTRMEESYDEQQREDLELMIKEALDTKRKVRIMIVEMHQKENTDSMSADIARVMELRNPRS